MDSYQRMVALALELATRSNTLAARAVLGKAGHDVNNVLTGIRGARDWLTQQTGPGRRRGRGGRDLDLVLDRLSKLSPVTAPYTGEPADLGPVLEELAMLWGVLGRSQMRVSCPEPQRVACDARAVQAAVLSLASSAQAAGASAIEIEIVAGTSETEIRVSDDGAPVSPLGAHRLFDPTRDEGARSGLSGSIARRLTQDVGGYARAEAREVGVMVALFLPRA